MPTEELLTINVMPGWRRGTRITFPEKGSEHPGVVPADLVFVVDEKAHEFYQREGHDLICTQKITLAEALTDFSLEVTTLDGRQLVVALNEVITPGFEKVIKGEGMPVKENGRKGNLKIRFEIKFPSKLTQEQKGAINTVLGRAL